MARWLVKTEPSECSIDDFAGQPGKPIPWDGVRNYQARNFLARMKEGDTVFIYHSSCKDIGISGVVRAVGEAYPDKLQFDPDSPYYDPKSSPDKPRWQAVDLVFEQKLPQLIPLERLKAAAELENLPLVKRGNRLSVMPVEEHEWHAILQLSHEN